MKIFVKILLTAILPGACPLYAAQIGDADFNSLKVSSLKIEKTDSRLYVDMEFDPSRLVMAGNREGCYTPMLVNCADTLRMKPFTIAGRNRYYNHLRNDAPGAPALYRAGEMDSPMRYRYDAPLIPWMETASVVIATDEYGCCSEPKEMADVPVAQIDLTPKTFMPEYSYVVPKAEAVKMRSISARAYIDFPVNRTELYPDYRRNAYELDVIHKTINTVKDDADVSIDSVSIKGFASPEGPYNNNVRLAKGRTQTLTEYVRTLCAFEPGIMRQAFEPEDWQGLVKRLNEIDIENREQILAIASDSSIEPDARNSMIQKRFPAQYKWLLDNVYPALRHSDYVVYYTVVDYSDPAKIAEVLRTAPGKLSLGEMFTLANTLEPGSKEYLEVFDIAVRLYPDNAIANLNAANTALMQRDYTRAGSYLTKAGDSPEADYLRGVFHALNNDYTTAMPLLRKAAAAGLKQADDALSQIETQKLDKTK